MNTIKLVGSSLASLIIDLLLALYDLGKGLVSITIDLGKNLYTAFSLFIQNIRG